MKPLAPNLHTADRRWASRHPHSRPRYGQCQRPAGARQAAADGLTLITADRGDFGRELALTRAVAPSVVLLRQLPDVVRAADVAALLLANLTPAVASALYAGAFVVLTPRAVRVRHLPLR